jgi:twitching motility protein PilT
VNIVGGDLARYVESAWQHGCSDILLIAGSAPLVRLDGEMRSLMGEPVLDEATIHAHLRSVLSAVKLAEFDDAGEVDFTVGWQGGARLRGNAYMQRGLPTIALRLIPEKIPTFDELAMPYAVRELAKLHQGLILFTGPTGSGKSTSLAALVGWINENRACHVLTIEDPIEYVHTRKLAAISQREVGSDTKSFERALRAALREDPDVILVGEMRDPESIAITLTLAETGHLVLSTLHTNDSAQALDRIVDVFPPERQAQVRFQLAGTLRAIVAQRLVPRIGGGMTSAFEVLIANTAVRNLIREGKSVQLRNNLTLGQAEGMQTLEMSLNWLVSQGVITYDDALSHAVVPKDIVKPVAQATQRA